MKSNILPVIIILVCTAVVGGCAVRCFFYNSEEKVQYIGSYEKELDTNTSGTKYVMDEVSPPKKEEIEAKQTEAQDTSELERIVEDLSKQAEKSNIVDP
ncbi:hypothetical protein [Butyrivibrio sp. AE2005]|uniref:hypothetical protein n=1 Tax=Butyrivibrio sp. AE2005 TaxID=1496722 RepID=UPI00047AA002|nr:hypothetical protein [Butyrivibrio sp. AE2005]